MTQSYNKEPKIVLVVIKALIFSESQLPERQLPASIPPLQNTPLTSQVNLNPKP